MIATAIERDLLRGIGAPKVITSEAQNERYIGALLEMEHQGGSRTKAEKNFMELLTLLVEAYEEKQYPIRSASPVEVLTELMTANGLRQKDLAPVFGAESIVSEVLRGKRELNKHHIEKLSERFHVSPELFFDTRHLKPIGRPSVQAPGKEEKRTKAIAFQGRRAANSRS